MEVFELNPDIETLKNKAVAFADNSRDYTVDPHDMSFDANDGDPVLNFNTQYSSEKLPIRSFAIGQICEKLNVPARYINRCIEENPELATKNVNEWLKKYDDPLFVRTTYSNVKGVLSTKYTPYDSDKILEDLDAALTGFSEITSEKIGKMSIRQSYLTDEELQVRLISNNPLDLGDGEQDELFPGIIVSSSDVGRHSLSARFFIYKQICTNGLMVPTNLIHTSYRHVHMGVSSDEIKAGFLSVLKGLPVVSENMTDVIEATQNEDLPADPYDEKFEDYLHNNMNFSKVESVNIAEIIRSGKYKMTKWGLINAITEAAQKCTLDRRMEMESQAGSYMIAA